MNFDSIRKDVEPLFSHCEKNTRTYLSKIFNHASSYSLYESLDNELFVRHTETDPKNTLIVCSCEPQEGRSTIALILAVLAAAFEPKKKVLLIDGDFYNGGLSQLLNTGEKTPGLHEYFTDKIAFKKCVHETVLKNLSFAPMSENLTESPKLSQEKFKKFMEMASTEFDLVIIDSSSNNRSKSFMSMAKIVKNSLLVIKYNGPTRQQIQNLVDDLELGQAEIIGAVISQRKFDVPWIFYG
ncbi:MAG: AAA family ATPase [Gammaproteobacteria bacterium]|nr:AAA family ATPase [Pseudomonadales bacterium]